VVGGAFHKETAKMGGWRHPDIELRPEAATLKVLVVDDHEANRRIMNILFTEFGCRPVLAACGEEAVDYAAAEAFDLIVMDLNMPGIDGDETTQLIRADGASKDAFVVRWTTEFVRFGPGLYDSAAPKPMTLPALEEMIYEACRRAADRSGHRDQEAPGPEHSAKRHP
jgi:DNA-binding response OmpR family regulator